MLKKSKPILTVGERTYYAGQLNLLTAIPVIFIHQILTIVDDIVWGPFMMALLIGTGLYLTFRLKGVQARKLAYAIRLILKPKEEGRGDTYRHFVL